MNKNIKGLIVVGVVGVIAYIVYKKYTTTDFETIAKFMDFKRPQNAPHLPSDYKPMAKDNPDYIKNWARAIKNKQNTFSFNNKQYDTDGGGACRSVNCGYK